MLDETNINQEIEWFHRERAGVVVANLQKRKINAQYVASRQEALTTILEMIPEGVAVGRADSISLEEIGIIPELKKRNLNKIIDPFEILFSGLPIGREQAQQMHQMEREVLLSDVFLTGTNAVTLDGQLVNIDGSGNRVSAMIFGPEKVIIAVGINKIVKDVNEALERIHQFAAPLNAKRHYLKHNAKGIGDLPCAKTGRCVDCNHDMRICNITVIIEGAFDKERINVVLVGEELGI